MLEEYIDQQTMIEKLQACIAIRSLKSKAEPGMPYGREVYRALEYVLNLAAEMGFRTANIDGHVGYVEYGEGDEMIAVLGLVDLVRGGVVWSYLRFVGGIGVGDV